MKLQGSKEGRLEESWLKAKSIAKQTKMKDWIWKSFVLFCFSINERKKGRWKLVDGRMEWFDGRCNGRKSSV